MKNILILVFGVFCSIAVAQIPTDGLVAHYPFNGNANDESGNGYNGQVFGATLTADRFGNANSAFSFDGDNDFIWASFVSAWSGSTATTFSCWYRTDFGYSNGYGALVGHWKNNGQYNGPIGLQIHLTNDGSVDVSMIGGQGVTSDANRAIGGNWHKVDIVFNGNLPVANRISLYCDGQFAQYIVMSNAPSQLGTQATRTYIGASCGPDGLDDAWSHFKGEIDDVLLYNRALSANEISEIYQNQSTSAPSLTCAITSSAGVICSGESAQLTVSTNQVIPSNGWTQLGNLDVPIHAGAGAIYNGKIIMAAGGDQVSNQLLVRTFDLSSLQSATINAPIPHFVGEPGFGFYNQKLYVMGGYDSGPTNFNQSFDMNTLTWSLNSSMPTTRSVLSSAQIEDDIYVIGGWPGEQLAFERYNVITNTWEILPNIPTPRHSVNTAAAINGKVYFFAGKNAWLTTYFNKNEMYDPVTNVWVEKSPTPFANYGASACAHNGKIYVLGGATGTYQEAVDGVHPLSNKLWIYTPETDSWEEGASFPKYIHLAQLLSDGNDLYCVGGICSETPTGTKYTSSAVYKLGTSNSNAYAWSTGENTASINVTPVSSATYSCSVSQGNQTCTASVDITVKPNITNAITANITDGESYILGTQTLSTSGTYIEVFTSAAGCDSTVTLTLFVYSNCLPSYVPTNGLLGYWPFCGNANDESGNGNNGVVSGAILSDDRNGNAESAYFFPGDMNNKISVPHNNLFNFSDEFSASVWGKFESPWTFHQEDLVYKSPSPFNSNSGWGIWVDRNIGDVPYIAGAYMGTVPNGIASVSTLGQFSNVNVWRHYVMTYKNQEIKLYLNGLLVDSVQVSNENVNTSTDFIIGGSKHPVSGAYDRRIDDVGLWNRALTLQEIQALYFGEQAPCSSVVNTISASIVQEQFYTFGTQTLTTAGTYIEVFTSAAGCDSTVTLTLSVEPLLTCSITSPATILCEGESITLSLNAAGVAGASSQLPANLQEGLMAYYPFNGNANDESGNGNDAVNFGADLTSGRSNKLNEAFEFSLGDYMEIANSQSLNISSDITLSVWAKFDLPQGYSHMIWHGDEWGAYDPYTLSIESGNFIQFRRDIADQVVIQSDISQFMGDLGFHMYTATYESLNGNWNIYIDGILHETIINQFNVGYDQSNMWTIIGGVNHFGTFQGVLDEVAIYNRTLSPSEIQQLYTAQSYAWSTNETTPTITVSPIQTTTYTATVTTATQTCTDSITITVNPLLTWYADADADGFGNPNDVVQDCNQPQGYIANNTDCDDEDASSFPGGTEICDNNRDEDCNGVDSLCFFVILGCTDVNACNFNPEANTEDNSCILPQPETCNGLDDNCNGQVDEGFTIPNINAVAATPALYPTCTGNALKSANLLTGTDSPVIAGSGPDLWYSFTAQHNTLRVGLSAAFGDNSIGLYTNNNGCLELITEEHEVYIASTLTTGNQILLTDQLTVGQTYYVAVHQITGPANASAKVCFTYLNESSCDHYYSNNTGVYTNVCNSFKAQYRANANNYLFNVLSGTQNGVNMNLTPWTYTNNNSNSVVARLGSIIPANHSGVNRVYTLSVPTVYGLTDAAGNVSNLVANATSTCTVTLNSEATITLRQADRCPTNKSLTSTIAPDRTVCGAIRYDWEFTEVLPNPGTAQVVQGGAYASVFFLSNVPGITAGKTYNVRVRPVHSSGITGNWGAVQCLRVGSAGMMNHPGSADADPPLLRAGGEMDAGYAIYPNPTSTGSFVLQYNGPRRGELIFAQEPTISESIFAQESMMELVMMDITGKIVFKTNVVLNGNMAEIHFGDLESGLYLVEINGGVERAELFATRVQVMR